MRDNFTKRVADDLARRSAFKCSNPLCRSATVGPDQGGGTSSIGVAAHITAAAPGGPRFDSSLTTAQRSSIDNGIWLCSTCSKLIDVDIAGHSKALLSDWKAQAESRARWAIRGYDIVKTRGFDSLAIKMPELIGEMRQDLIRNPFTREFILLKKKWTYNGQERPYFTYFFEDHDKLLGKLDVCVNYRAVVDIKFNNIDRYRFVEDFVDFLVGPNE